MILIAHRGLTQGPNPLLENHPHEIERCLSQQLHVEIDVWWHQESWWLGHDAPQYKIDQQFLHQHGLWIHAKNDQAAFELSKIGSQHNLNFFWHENDQRTLTSLGYWWTFPAQTLSSRSVAVMPEWHQKDLLSWAQQQTCAGICSDFVGDLTR